VSLVIVSTECEDRQAKRLQLFVRSYSTDDHFRSEMCNIRPVLSAVTSFHYGPVINVIPLFFLCEI
jgi:hypothetical protein